MTIRSQCTLGVFFPGFHSVPEGHRGPQSSRWTKTSPRPHVRSDSTNQLQVSGDAVTEVLLTCRPELQFDAVEQKVQSQQLIKNKIK